MASKLTAEECKHLILKLTESRWGGKISIKEKKYLEALEIALQVLEVEPVADVVAWNHPSEERKCSVQLRRFDLKPGPLFMLAQQPTTDTYRQIENDGWIEWDGVGGCPVAAETSVIVRLTNPRDTLQAQAGEFEWSSEKANDPITAYRVIENDGREG